MNKEGFPQDHKAASTIGKPQQLPSGILRGSLFNIDKVSKSSRVNDDIDHTRKRFGLRVQYKGNYGVSPS